VTTIKYSLAKPERVKLVIYDIHGRQVQVLMDAQQRTGLHQVSFNAKNLASGVYFYRLEAGAFVDEKRMLILK
jgi:hypothetical protein